MVSQRSAEDLGPLGWGMSLMRQPVRRRKDVMKAVGWSQRSIVKLKEGNGSESLVSLMNDVGMVTNFEGI